MSIEENKAILRYKHVDELFNKANLSIADEIISPDYIYHSPLGFEFKGPEGVKRMVSSMRDHFPDLHFTIDDMIAEGDWVAVRYSYAGTHKGEFMGIAPTSKRINLTTAIFYRFVNGKEVEALEYNDMLAVYQQLGVSPPSQ